MRRLKGLRLGEMANPVVPLAVGLVAKCPTDQVVGTVGSWLAAA